MSLWPCQRCEDDPCTCDPVEHEKWSEKIDKANDFGVYQRQLCVCGHARKGHRAHGVVPNCTECEDAGRLCRGFERKGEAKP